MYHFHSMIVFDLKMFYVGFKLLLTCCYLEVSSSKDACTHPGSFGDMCILCGQMLNEETGGVTFGYIHKVYYEKVFNVLMYLSI